MKTLVILLSLAVTCSASSASIHKKLYIGPFEGFSPCVRRLNATHATGCSTSPEGDVGVIHIVKNVTDLQWVLQESRAGSYVLFIEPEFFTTPFLEMFQANHRVSGVILVDRNIPSNFQFSPDDKCPNGNSGLTDCPKNPWNPKGNFMMHKSWRFPIFLTKPEFAKQMEDCFEKFNKPLVDQHSRRLCSLRIQAHMLAAGNAEMCRRRMSSTLSWPQYSFCDPLGDKSVYGTLHPIDGKSKKWVIVASQLDATSMFPDASPGALTAATSIVTLMLTAKNLVEASIPSSDMNILFVFFNGESYDYIGSSRMAYDMERGAFPNERFPISLQDISLFVDISQISTNRLTLNYRRNDVITKKFISFLRESGAIFGISIEERVASPPTSYQSFPQTPGLALTSYNGEFQNKFYNSHYDQGQRLGYVHWNKSEEWHPKEDSLQIVLTKVSLALSLALHKMLVEDAQPPSAIDYDTADELLHCYLNTTGCNMFAAVKEVVGQPPNLYVGISGDWNRITILSQYTLASLLGSKMPNLTQEDCHKENDAADTYEYYWFNVGKSCVKASVYNWEAVSPAFLIPDYNFQSGQYSTWMESVWQGLRIDIFLKPSPSYEINSITCGLAVAIVSFVTVFLVHLRRDILFESDKFSN